MVFWQTTIHDLSIIFTAFLSLHFILLPYLCSNIAYSIYFKKVNQVDEQVEYDFDEDIEYRTENNDMAIIVQTSSRDTSYRNRTLISLYTELLKSDKAGHQVLVCSTEGTDNSLEMPVISQFKSVQPCLIPTEDCINAFNQKDKEKKIVKDFVLCYEAIENKINEDVKHLLWLEDDVILMEDFFSTLSSIMTFREILLQSQKWLDIKLYLNPRLRGTQTIQI